MKQWTLSKSSFDNFLALLDSDRNRAGQKYESLRIKLVKFFEWRACQFADNLADQTLDRVARKIDSGEKIDDYLHYTFGVARFLYMETVKKNTRERAVIINMPVSTNDFDEENSQLSCLESCLKKLSEDNRKMILRYYYNDRQAKIDYRKKIAENLGISVNALRIKALRIRAKLEDCVFECLKNDSA
jgi:DNA-directed RNA polymerase specialized sigma24 family protein